MHQQLTNISQTSVLNHLGNTISKSKLAQKLNICRSTLIRFHQDFALKYIADYEEAFPFVNGETKDDLPLNQYQAWVLARMVQLYLKVPTILVISDLHKEDVLESFDLQSFSRFKLLN
jgi:hypothetical protein